jgi:Putative  PD-(D/E)XK family member, (DUF4420)
MTELLTELRAKWAQALASGKADREWRAVALSIAAPVNLLAGVRDRDGRISVLVETVLQHAPRHRVRFQAEGISLIDERWIEDGLLRLAVTLERPDLRDIFEILAIDLISVAAASSSAQSAIQQILRRLGSWQVCLRARRGGLQREEQAGLLGEIAVLQKLADEIGFPQAIAAWTGPLDGIHDFQLGGLVVEVKSTIGVSHHIRISRLDQLDAEGLDQLLLARMRFHEAPEGMTLPEVIGGLRKTVSDMHPASIDEFADKIMRTGYLETDAEFYASMRTVLSDFHLFKVGEGFPRLTRASVPSAVVEAAYSLDERQLGAFRVADEAWHALLRRVTDTPQMCGA